MEQVALPILNDGSNVGLDRADGGNSLQAFLEQKSWEIRELPKQIK